MPSNIRFEQRDISHRNAYAADFLFAIPEHLRHAIGLHMMPRTVRRITSLELVNTGLPDIRDGDVFYDHHDAYERPWSDAVQNIETVLQVTSGSPSPDAFGGGTVVFRVLHSDGKSLHLGPRSIGLQCTQAQFIEVLRTGLGAI